MFESFLFALTVSIDAFITGFSYGVSKIKIPFLSALFLNSISTGMIFLSLTVGNILKQYIDQKVLPLICFLFLFIIGMIRLSDSLIKNYIQRKGKYQSEVDFTLFNLKFILKVYSSPLIADQDLSKNLSLKESISLGFALSLDGTLVGLGAALTTASYLYILVFTFSIGFMLTILGHFLGDRIGKKTTFDPSFISGILLLILAFSKL